MSRITAAITAVHGYLPPDILTNKDIEKLVETNDEWIKSRTGIEQRHILKGEGLGTSDMVVPAVNAMLAKAGVNPLEIDLVIVATVTPDMPVPSCANLVCNKVGMTNAWGFDLNAACSGFLYALTTGAQFIETGKHKKVVVVGADKMSSIINYQDRSTCIIFGDGAACVLLEPSTEGFGVMDSQLHSDGNGSKYLNVKRGGSAYPLTDDTIALNEHYVFQEGQTVFKSAVKGMVDTLQQVMSRNGLTPETVNWVVPHQANKRIIDAVGSMAGIDTDKVMVNIQKYGNTTAATIPLCLWEWEDKLKKGDNVLLTSFGAGYTWGTVLLKWGK